MCLLSNLCCVVIIHQGWQSLSGPSGYEDLNKISVAPYYSFEATKRAIASLKIQVEEVTKIEISKISGAGLFAFSRARVSLQEAPLHVF